MDEVLAVMRSEIDMARDRRMLRCVAAVLAAGLILTIAAVAGLTFAVVAPSKDTASSGGALVDKVTGVPLATGAARGVQELSGLWQGDADTSMSLAGLTEFYTNGADGVQRMWRVAGVEVAAGKWARVNTTEPGVSLYIDAEGMSLEGVPADQAGGTAAAGRRRLLGNYYGGATCTCNANNAGTCCCATPGKLCCIAGTTYTYYLELRTATCCYDGGYTPGGGFAPSCYNGDFSGVT